MSVGPLGRVRTLTSHRAWWLGPFLFRISIIGGSLSYFHFRFHVLALIFQNGLQNFLESVQNWLNLVGFRFASTKTHICFFLQLRKLWLALVHPYIVALFPLMSQNHHFLRAAAKIVGAPDQNIRRQSNTATSNHTLLFQYRQWAKLLEK